MGQNVRRGVAYCLNTECKFYHSSVFMLFKHTGHPSLGEPYVCPTCEQTGVVVPEVERRIPGDFAATGYGRVEVRFNWDPAVGYYRGSAIVVDHAIYPGSSQFILESPLIKTERRALAVAESAIANLNLGRDPGRPPASIDLDQPPEVFAAQCERALARPTS
jgi:hypothetical protein